MDITTLVTFLTPCLPFLLKVGDKISEGAAQKIGEDTWNTAKTIWGKLHPKIEAKPAAKEALADVANNPDDADYQASLRVQIKKILEADKPLWDEIAKILADSSTKSPQAGKFNINAQGSNIGLIGDGAKVDGGINFGTKPGA
jgi:hypothetical protein